MSTRTASCSCGALRVTCTGEPVRISMCHCTECQKRTGAPFGAQARWPVASVRIEGASTAWTRTGDSGNTATFHFCPVCGATVFYLLDPVPDVIAVALGNFADRDFPPPRFSVYEVRRHPWVAVPQDAERHE
jgi:hypothetical protein